MYQQITIKTLKAQGKSIASIARDLQVHRNTVRHVLNSPVEEKHTRNKPSVFVQYHTRIETLLTKGLTKQRIWEILKEEEHLTVGYEGLLKYLQSRNKYTPKTAYVVQQTTPGEEAEIDFGYAGLIPTTEGLPVKTWLFVMILSYSRNSFYGSCTDQKVETLIRLCEAAFQYFGGIPKSIKLDNLKAAVLKNKTYDLEFNPHFLSFSSHSRFIIKPCTPRHPHQKGKVESGIKYVKENFLPGRLFKNLQDFNAQLTHWMNHTANTRIHGTTKQIPQQIFLSEEQQTLQPLPDTAFPIVPILRRKVKLNCHIQYEETYYSVPSQYVGQIVDVRIRDHILDILNDKGVCIATHHISHQTGRYVTNDDHFPQHKVYSETSYQQKYEEKMKTIGTHAHLLFKHIVATDHMGWKRQVGKILLLLDRFSKETVDKACKRALAFQAYHWRTVTNICEKQLQDGEIEPRLVQGENAEEHGMGNKHQEGVSEKAADQEEKGNGEPQGNGVSVLERELSYYER